MRPRLLSADRDLDLESLPVADPTLVGDLGLDRLLEAMARGDRDLDDVARRVVVSPLMSVEAIRYRQATVVDALASPEVVRELYAIAVDAIEGERKVWGGAMRNAEFVLDRAAEVIGLFLESFRAMRRIEAGHAHAGAFTSPGFVGFFELVRTQLDDAWLAEADDHVHRLRTRTLHVSARLGPGNRGTAYVLHRQPSTVRSWRGRLGLEERRSTVEVLLSDQNAVNMIAELRALAIAPTAGAVHESAQQVLGFFKMLRAELGFLVGCLNLHEALGGSEARVCMPDPVADGEPAFAAEGLYDPGLRLAIDGPVVGNDVTADGMRLVVITGANGGGKSTLLRAVGLAQVMAQAGMFVAADRFAVSLRSDVRTHFTREEDAAMAGGRLDEELGRLGALIDACSPTSLVLLNESLSSTNEREGAEIARQVVTALVDSGVSVWFVTHNYQFAADLHRAGVPWARFLRAERGGDGERSFQILEAPPLPTSHGMDLYRRIVGDGARDPEYVDQLPFEADGIRYAICTTGDLAEMARVLAATFTATDPPAVAVGLTPVEFEAFVTTVSASAADDRLTIVARDVTSGQLAGALLTEDAASPADIDLDRLSPRFEAIFDLFGQLEGPNDGTTASDAPRPGDTLHLFLLGVERGYARRGIAQHLVGACLTNGAARGYRTAVTEATNLVSQHVFRKAGFAETTRTSYADYRRDGVAVFASIAEHGGPMAMTRTLPET